MRLDPLLTAADAALRTLFVPARASRDCPTVPERPNEALSDDERQSVIMEQRCWEAQMIVSLLYCYIVGVESQISNLNTHY